MTSVEWLMWERGPEDVRPDEETMKKITAAKKKSRPRKASGDQKGDTIITNNEAPVIFLDQSQGDGDKSANPVLSSIAASKPDAGELLGLMMQAIDDVYRERKLSINIIELGRIAYRHHAALSAIAADPGDFPDLISMVKRRVAKALDAEKEPKP